MNFMNKHNILHPICRATEDTYREWESKETADEHEEYKSQNSQKFYKPTEAKLQPCPFSSSPQPRELYRRLPPQLPATAVKPSPPCGPSGKTHA